MIDALLVALLGLLIGFVLAGCNRGIRIPGPHWFELSWPANRTTRRKDRR